MNDIEKRFSPLLGKLAWGLSQTTGSCFFIQFGNPHIETHGPLPVDENTSENARRLRRRRRAYVRGEWSLLVTCCSWELRAWDTHATHDHSPEFMDVPFETASGQYLKSVEYDEANGMLLLEFDLGARLSLRPGEGYEPESEQWTLHDADGTYTSLLNNGELSSG